MNYKKEDTFVDNTYISNTVTENIIMKDTMIEADPTTDSLTVVDSVEVEATTESVHYAPQLVDLIDSIQMERNYDQIMYVHEAAIQMVVARLNILKGEFQFSNDRNPISSISSRIKSKESIVHKMEKKGLPMSFTAMQKNIRDIAGVRVVCPFIEDVYYVARMLARQKTIDLIDVKDYIREPKENGYRSLHLIINVTVDLSHSTIKVPVEVQIRTIAMNFWASTEHQLRYKKNRVFTEEEQKKLKECANLMAEADKKMQEVAGDFDFNMESW